MNSITLYFRYVAVSLRSQMQYRASFVMLTVGHFLTTGIEFLAIWVLFDRFNALSGWSLAEVAFFYGLLNVAFALAEAVGRGFDMFPNVVKSGDFDRFLLRPRSTALQIGANEVQALRIGRMTQGLVVLFWAASTLNVSWSVWRVGLILFAIAGGMALFIGLFIIQATISFWTIESLELMNTLTYGGVQTGQYPLSIYRTWFRRFFTFVVPLASVSYFPALAVLGRPDAAMSSPLWFQCAAPLMGFIFFGLTLVFWRFGERHYHSTGS